MNKENSNLSLWDSVCETDPLYTKPASKGKYHFTSIAPVYQFKMATEAFGIQGIHWGVKIGSEVFHEKEYGTTIILSYDAILFFTYNGERGEIPIHASEKSCYQTQGSNGYMKIDDEVRKKVVTNAKTKGLSELGFNADVFMGMFDDPNYVDYRNYEESLDKADDRDAETKIKTNDLTEWCKKESAVYPSLKNERTLTLVFAENKNKVIARCGLLKIDSGPYVKGFEKAFNEQLKIINDKKVQK